MMAQDPALLPAGLLFAALIISAYTDVARGKVYNWCTYPAILLGIASHCLIGYQTGDWLWIVWGVLGLLIGAGLFLLPYRFGLVGGGDVKLMGAVGALQGPNFVILSAFLSAVVGAIFGLSILIWKGRLREGLRNFGGAMLRPWKLKERTAADDTRLPYGLAIALGTFWAWFVAEGLLG